jgi:hypothetical protein
VAVLLEQAQKFNHKGAEGARRRDKAGEALCVSSWFIFFLLPFFSYQEV